MKLSSFEETSYLDRNSYSDRGEGIRIVAIDDEPDVVETIVQLMQDFGFEIVGETDPRKGLSVVADLKPDAVLLDIMMPGMDGYEFAGEMAASADTCEIPIVYLTSKGIRDDLCQSFSQGGTMYVKKPFLAQELAESIRIAVSLAKAV